MKMKTNVILILCMVLVLVLSGCNTSSVQKVQESTEPSSVQETDEKDAADESSQTERRLILMIGSTPVDVTWEDNESVKALKELVKDAPLTVQMSMYSDFEQVGSLGETFPKNDEKITTQSGDIVLYSGNQIVIFYGSNSWAYTRFGRITDKDTDEMTELLGNGDISVTIALE